jgi:hypothetical protein
MKAMSVLLSGFIAFTPTICMAEDMESQLRSNLNEATGRFNEMISLFGPNDSRTMKIQEQIKNLKEKLGNLASNTFGTVERTATSSSELTATRKAKPDLSDLAAMGPSWKADMVLANYCLASGDLMSAQILFQMAYAKAVQNGISMNDAKSYAAEAAIRFDGMMTIPGSNNTGGSTTTGASTGNTGGSITGTNVNDTTWAQSFNSTRIIPDVVFNDHTSMTQQEVQSFLAKRDSVLSKPYKGQMPSEMIMNAARKYGVSPKLILATLQKEQGLVSKKNVPEHKLDWALGVGCYDSGDWNTKYKGLDKQIEYAAATYRNRYDEAVKMQREGKELTLKVDGKQMTFSNASTWALYRYTPHIQGNQLFFNVYKGYFVKK